MFQWEAIFLLKNCIAAAAVSNQFLWFVDSITRRNAFKCVCVYLVCVSHKWHK